ncbi:MAG TPA: ClbS/DfsB family four-helix bundle protein [Anaerolineae bacterium]|jgi:hypothetical protein
MKKDELLLKITQSRAHFDAIVAQVPTSEMTKTSLYNTWSVKDLLAHIGWWEQRACDVITALLAGRTPSSAVETSDVDALNAETFKQNYDRTVDDITSFEGNAYRTLLALIVATSESGLTDARRFAWTQGKPLWNWVAWNTWEHYDEHLIAIQTWLASRSG